MDTIDIKGTKYKKASVLAREHGYTSDYLGQLCRSEKVTAKLVGRTWYVEPSSLHDHKNARYRSVKEKSQQQVREHVSSLATPKKQSTVRLHPVSYESDDEDLFPLAKKRIREVETVSLEIKKPISLKHSIQVKSNANPVVMQAYREEDNMPKQSGVLAVSSADEGENIEFKEFTEVAKSTIVERQFTDKKKALNQDQSESVSYHYSFTYTLITTTLSVICALLVSIVFLSLEVSTEYTADSKSNTLDINFQRTASVLQSALK